ncbi:hypothetical protein [Nodularia sp. NIES-3585]|uniref:hypothetical protein n=1 Tax=Nodularia sp. NIES-3585 TaxID=1973477 RepID=UPI0011312D8E|nr:hypothetical protein [Nodularia sp. NIES-3585]
MEKWKQAIAHSWINSVNPQAIAYSYILFYKPYLAAISNTHEQINPLHEMLVDDWRVFADVCYF